ncbi:hypothetical protein D3C84_1068020 [compost metagenome]
MRVGEARPFKRCVAKIDAAQVGGAEVGVGEVDAVGVHLAQVQAAEITTDHVDRPLLGALFVEASDVVFVQQGVERGVEQFRLAHFASPVGFMTPV